jgi:long-chain fatty acid transport protein
MGSPRFAAAAAGFATLAFAAADVHAGGLFLPGIGPSAVARAGAWIATADDPTALATNPAGLGQQWGTVVYIGSTFLDYSMSFARRGNYESEPGETHPWDGQPYPVVTDASKPPIGFGSFQALPTIAVSTDAGLHVKGLRFGAGVFVPTSYPTRSMDASYVFDDPNTPPPPTRYDVVDQQAAIVMLPIGASYAISDKLLVGARFVWGIANIKATTYTWGFPGNFNETTTKDSLFHLEATDNFAPAYGAGLLYKLNDDVQLGAQYTSQLSVNAVGTGTAITSKNLVPPVVLEPADQPHCAPGGTAESLKGCIDIALPMSAGIGARYLMHDTDGRAKGDLELNVQWENWGADDVSNYKVTVDAKALGIPLKQSIISHGLKDTFSFRLGGAREITDAVALRAGVAYDTKAAKDSWERADLDGAARFTFAGGGSYKAGKLRIDAGLGYVYEGTRSMGSNPPCNPTSSMAGCDGSGVQTPVADRTQPDPIQPLADPNNNNLHMQSPINSGTITSHYVFFLLAANYQF